MVEDMGVATGVDLEAMIAAAGEAERIVGRTLPSQVLRAGPRIPILSEKRRTAGGFASLCAVRRSGG